MAQTFTATQQIGLPTCVYITDTSTGLSNVASRRAYIQDVQSNYLVPSGTTTDYTVWALVDTSISIDCLSQDTCAYVKIEWMSAGGTVLYTLTTLCNFRLNNLQESFSLTQSLTSDPSLIQDTDWFLNKMILRCNIDDSVQAVEIGGNQQVSQAALNRATAMTQSQSLYF